MAGNAFFEEPTWQSRIKASIVSEYFHAWAKVILSRHGGRIAYVDLFAGPGRYEDGSSSTPLLVLEKAIQDDAIRRSVSTVFSDENSAYVTQLESNICQLRGVDDLARKPQVKPLRVGDEIAKEFQQLRLIPSLLFLDPWGYKGLSLGLVNSVLKDWACECIFFFNYNRINPAIRNTAVKRHMNDLFGKDRAERLRIQVESLPPVGRQKAILQGIGDALTERYGKYVLSFCFKNDGGTRPSHYLVFVTKHPRGYEIMKEIMAKKSSRHNEGVASFEFNPRDAVQARFELPGALSELGSLLLRKFAGRTMSMHQVYAEHNAGTPYVEKNYKDALGKLESEGRIRAEPHRKGTFGDNVKVTFPLVEGRQWV